MLQETALNILKNSKDNVFLTGAPGTGKSWLVDRYVEWLLENGEEPVITASTGIAALNINGKTLHSWGGLRNDHPIDERDQDEIIKGYSYENYISTQTLIIDEVSMVSAALLENINILAKRIRGDHRFMGGIRVIVVGDFFQLPPVKGRFAFECEDWDEADFTVCYLHENKRQSEPEFTDILQNIRGGFLTEPQKEVIRSKIIKDASIVEDPKIRLDTHNKKVDNINRMQLERLPGFPQTYKMQEDGPYPDAIEKLKKNCLSPEKLILKVDTPVLFTRNDSELRWVNGTQGVVRELGENHVVVELPRGELVEVNPVTWEACKGYGSNKKIYGEIAQLPLKHAWAITVHKSQGMTLDRVIIDVTHAFAAGQGYVAISRVRTLEGLHFQGFLTKGFFMVSKKVVAKDKEFLKEGMSDDISPSNYSV
ncbi:MAG: putative ATP-dependent DNA helicase [Prokaryotic dsDNA virus sp.]|nr:MAG: putative ATP-dependent DNA helicase [Prokaryotic dsDNA virus sp.]|tara:strand:- start:18469 stop:19740 length:1272 start_codon:yes stop_codon:yes gene_type:complete